MSHFRFLRPLVLSIICLSAGLVDGAPKPNILFILTDDQAPWALKLSGYQQASTPHLDKLFQEGAYLKNAFTVTPVCSPSRASLISGRYGSEVGITDWLHPKNEPEAGLDPATPTWPALLQKAGYKTALIGKWHLGLTDEMHPTKLGYDYFMGFRAGGASTENPLLEKNGEEVKMEGLTTDILTDEAINFLQAYTGSDAAEEKPFCMSLHYRAPHTRWLPVADDDWAPFAEMDPEIPNPDFPNLDVDRVKRMTREYLASVKGVDRNVGRLMKFLEDQGLVENTIVIYSSDHGYNMGHSGIWHKGNGHYVLTKNPPGTENVPAGQRPNMFDRSIKVPTAVRWPGVIKPGTVIEETVSNLDWFPTFLELAGAETPQDVPLRGQSIVRLLKGDASDWDDDFFAQYSTKHQSRTHMRMYRTPQWKLVRDYLNPDRDELYDLANDPEETTNLIESDAETVKAVISQLDAKLQAEMKAIGDSVAN